MSSSSTVSSAERDARALHDDGHGVRPSEIAIGVIIGRTAEAFEFFVFAIAAVIVFPQRFFSFADPVTATMLSFALFALAFVARPIGTGIFTRIDRDRGKGAKLTAALFLMGTSTVAMGLVPSYATLGGWSIFVLAMLRIGQGLALGGVWDGLPSLLALNAPENRRGFFAMIPQLGAPLGLIMASLLFVYLVTNLSATDFLDWGWRYPFFVAFAVNVVALFARLRLVVTPSYTELFEKRELEPRRIRDTVGRNFSAILLAALVPLASFALFHMVTVFPLSWVYLYTTDSPADFLLIEAVSAVFGLIAVYFSGHLADRFGRRAVLRAAAATIAVFSVFAPVLLSMGGAGEALYMIVGFIILGISYGQSSGAVATLFAPYYRYTASAIVSDWAWLLGAGFAPLVALGLASWLGLWASGLYLLSGAVVTILALVFVRRLRENVQS